MRLGNNFKARLILAIISTAAEEVAIYVIWRWGLPEVDMHLPLAVVIVLMVGWGVFAVTNFIIVTRVLRKQTVVGLPTMVGSKGKVAKAIDPEGLVRIRGELWTAESVEGALGNGEQVDVVGEDGLRLIVRRRGGG